MKSLFLERWDLVASSNAIYYSQENQLQELYMAKKRKGKNITQIIVAQKEIQQINARKIFALVKTQNIDIRQLLGQMK